MSRPVRSIRRHRKNLSLRSLPIGEGSTIEVETYDTPGVGCSLFRMRKPSSTENDVLYIPLFCIIQDFLHGSLGNPLLLRTGSRGRRTETLKGQGSRITTPDPYH